VKIKNALIFIGVLVLAGCKTIGPAAFWNDFDDGHMVKNITDQGPWGGYRLLYWKNTQRPYKAKDVVIFAALHNWQHFKTDSLKKEEVFSWVADHADSLSLHHPSHYPAISDTGVSLSFLDSNWASTGNSGSNAALGYALLSSDGKQLVVYDTWGE
jgi:hypothetical protein